MPSGRTHDIITINFLPILMITLFFLGVPTSPIIYITIAYLFSSFMFNGDLDVPSRPYYRWFVLRCIWIPYQSFCSHRCLLSHGLIIGTLFRLFYIGIIPAIVLYFYGFDFSILLHIETVYVLIGLECGSALHTICDKIF